MSQKTIHPSKHAIERFEQRVLPHLPEESQKWLLKDGVITQKLYNLARRSDFGEVNEYVVHVPVFFTVLDYPPIPLTLVISHANNTIITLYITPLWENLGTNDSPNWRFSNE